MAKITLQILGSTNAPGNGIDAVISKVKGELDALGQKPIQIKLAAQGLDAIVAKLNEASAAETKAAEAAAKLANAEARKINAQTKAAAEARKSAAATKEVAAAEQKNTEALEKLSQAYSETSQRSKELISAFLESRNGATMAAEQVLRYRDVLQDLVAAAQRAQSSQIALRQSFDLTIQKAAAVANAAGYYGNVRPGLESGISGALPPYWDTSRGDSWTFGGGTTGYDHSYTVNRSAAIDVEWRDITEGTASAAAAASNAASAASAARSAFSAMGDGAKAAWAKLSEGTPVADALGDSVGNIIVKITTWQVVNGIVAGIKRSFKDALDTMREVDQELTNIQKVSDLTAKDIEKIGESAYDVASKYGVAADEYLQAVYTFQKAGLGDSATEMAELATKTMLVGDTTAEVATRFLISANAAWKFGGSVEELNRIVDEADKLNNTYAVSLEDIATGLPIVGATAAQVGMTAEQTMSAISTIVASTGQSATKAATALRAIIMNLIGETGELDDGLVVTEETIASLNTVLNVYAKDALAAADAAGEILDPMTAIAALAQAAEDGFLNEAQLFEVLSGLGGKLRTTQLTALVNNMEMYNSMLADTADAAGTADREISIMLDSWNSKTQILTNNFTQLISHLVDSDGIKAAIDLLNGFVVALDSGIGKVAALTAAFLATGKVVAMLVNVVKGGAIYEAIQMVILGAGTATEVIGMLTTAMLANPLFWGAAAAALVYGIAKAVDYFNVTLDEQKEKLSELQDEYDRLYGSGSEYGDLVSRIDELTEAEKRRLAVLEAEAEALRQQVLEQQKATFTTWRGTQVDIETTQGAGVLDATREIDLTAKSADNARSKLEALSLQYENGKISAAEYKKAIQELVVALKDDAEAIESGKEAGVELTASETALLNLYNSLTGALAAYIDETDGLADSLNNLQGETKTLADLMTEVENGLNEEADAATNAAMQTQFYALQAALASGQPIDTESAITSLSGLSAQSTNTAAALQALIAVFQQIESMDAQIASYTEKAANATGRKGQMYASRLGTLASQRAGFDVAGAFQTAYAEALANMPDTSGSGGGGGSSSSSDPRLDELKSIVSLEEQRLSFIEASNGSVDDQVSKMREIQDALHDEAEYLRSIEGESENVVKLSTEWWKYQKEIDKLLENTEDTLSDTLKLRKQELSLLEESDADTESVVAKMREIQALLEQQIAGLKETDAYLKGDLDTLTQIAQLQTEWQSYQNKINSAYEKEAEAAEKAREEAIKAAKEQALALLDAEEEAEKGPLQRQLELLEAQQKRLKSAREEEEKRLAVTKARIALENAQNERNVRQYNAKTGQWEWVANADTVAKAQQSLEDAKKALADFYVQKQIDVLKSQIASIEKTYDELRNNVNDYADAVADGTADFTEAMAYFTSMVKGAANSVAAQAGGKKTASGMTAEEKAAYIASEANGWAELAGSGGSAVEWYRDERGVGKYYLAKAKSIAAGQTAEDVIAVLRGGIISGQITADEAAATLAEITSRSGIRNNRAKYQELVDAMDDFSNGVYDSGGILRGKGGIKATRADEIILPPRITSVMLSAERGGGFDALLNHLGIVTAAAANMAGFGGGSSKTSIGTQNNGDTYQFGNISLSETQARSMTVYDLAQMARTLSLQNA